MISVHVMIGNTVKGFIFYAGNTFGAHCIWYHISVSIIDTVGVNRLEWSSLIVYFEVQWAPLE